MAKMTIMVMTGADDDDDDNVAHGDEEEDDDDDNDDDHTHLADDWIADRQTRLLHRESTPQH